jgi:F0F1-type ATP synthase membrane subunit b/b'
MIMVVMTPREKWTDERLDDLNKKVDKGFEETKGAITETKAEIKDLRQETKAEFAETKAEIKDLRQETKAEFAALRQEMKDGFEGLYRLLFKSAVAIVVALLGIIATLIGVSAL